MEGDFEEWLAKNEMHRADRSVEKRDVSDLLRRDGEDRADEKLLDVLCALRCVVERQHPDRRRHRIDDPDHGLLLQQFFVGIGFEPMTFRL